MQTGVLLVVQESTAEDTKNLEKSPKVRFIFFALFSS